jgi:hypothetical protein
VRLVIKQGPLAGQSIPLVRQAIVIGRGEGSDLRLPETGVSRQHVRFQQGPRGWAVVDLGSTNGTFVNGQRLPPHQPYLLHQGDHVAIGSSVLTLRAEGPEAAVPPEGGPHARGRPRSVVMAVGAVALIVVLVGLVILVVTLLQPAPEPPTPTVAGPRGIPVDKISTVLPVPTGFGEVITSVATLLPTSLPFFPLGATATPTPGAALRRHYVGAAVSGREMVQGVVRSATFVPFPESRVRLEGDDIAP